MSEHGTHDESYVGHETTDAEIAPLVRFAVFLAAITIAIAVATVGFYSFLDAREEREKAPRYPLTAGVERPMPPAPRLQTYPFDDIKALRKEEAQLIDHYGWVDKNAGTVRIPVTRAMELLAERGLPHRTEAPQAPTAPPQPGAANDAGRAQSPVEGAASAAP
jgi:hypothetical protein